MKSKFTAIILIIFILCLAALPAVASEGETEEKDFGALSLLPPLLAIILAFLTKQVLFSLFIGIFIGATMLNGWNPFFGLLRTLDEYMVSSLADSWHAGILIFTLTIGGMIRIVAQMGGTSAVAEALARRANNTKNAQIATWLLGILVFFDDYANTLIVGQTMRPLTDKMRISREKLAYIVDSTAAPIAGIALVSTWVGYELGLIKDAYDSLGITGNIYEVFLRSIPYRFYDIIALLMVVTVAILSRDIGPMYLAERRARTTGKVIADGAKPMASKEMTDITLKEGIKLKVSNAVIPVLTLIIVGFVGLWYNGYTYSENVNPFTWEGIRTCFGNADASVALIWAAVASTIVAMIMAIGQRMMTLGEAFDNFVEGVKSLLITGIILVLAWSLGAVTEQVGTADFLIKSISDKISIGMLPVLVFIIASVVSFATGTSWGTMAIVMPLAVPLAFHISGGVEPMIIPTLGAVLTGAIFGDHCSPISDTTIMSSMGAASDHIDHVRTQLPYAVLGATVAIIFGYLPAGMGLNPFISLLLAAAAVIAIFKFFGKDPGILELGSLEGGTGIEQGD